MVNVRCKVSDQVAAKVAYVARSVNRPRSEVYAWLVSNLAENFVADDLAKLAQGELGQPVTVTIDQLDGLPAQGG